jgi:hypothetical protein
MKVSNELLEQVERYSSTRSFSLNASMKKELSDWYKAMGFGKLNTGCSTCIRNAMGKLLKSINDGEHLKPRIHFIGIKQ